MPVKIVTGPTINGFVYTNEAEAIAKALPVLVRAYAEASGLDVQPAESQLVEVRSISRTGERSSKATTEVRVAGKTIASWREVAWSDI